MLYVTVFRLGLIALLGLTSWAATVTGSSDSALETVFRRLYNNDLAGSQQRAAGYVAANPQDALGQAARSTVLLYGELNRLRLLGDGMFAESEAKAAKPQPDPAVRQEFWATSKRAVELANATVRTDPANPKALLALSIAHGNQRDYAVFIEKRYKDSLDYWKQAQSSAVKLLKADPAAYDAYFVTGFTDGMLASLPFFVRLAAKMQKFEAIEPTMDSGIRKLEVAAAKGNLLRPYAQMMLAMFYKKEKRFDDSARVLAELHRQFPENQAFERELGKLKLAR